MICKYNTKLVNPNIFEELENKYGYVYPLDFRKFIEHYNAGIPEKYHIKIAGVERVVGSILSYNVDEKDVDSAFVAIDVIEDRKMLPFAVDPSGNYFCTFEGKVVFILHEENKIEKTDYSLKGFEDALY